MCLFERLCQGITEPTNSCRTNATRIRQTQGTAVSQKEAVADRAGRVEPPSPWNSTMPVERSAVPPPRLLPRYLTGRRRGPVFVTERRPNVVPADPDVCPDTGLGRLSYSRAWSAFKQACGGWTLHQLRHSSLTHLGEAGVSAILLQAKSRH